MSNDTQETMTVDDVESALRQIGKRQQHAELGSDLGSARVLAAEVRRLREQLDKYKRAEDDREQLAAGAMRLFDCKQETVCATPPGCMRHWEERNRELVTEVSAARELMDQLSASNLRLVAERERLHTKLDMFRLLSAIDDPGRKALTMEAEFDRLRAELYAADGRADVIFARGYKSGRIEALTAVSSLLEMQHDDSLISVGDVRRALGTK